MKGRRNNKIKTSTVHHGLPPSMNDAKQITAGLIEGRDNSRSIGGRNDIPLTSRLGSLKIMEKELDTCRPSISAALSPPCSNEDMHKSHSKSQLDSKNITTSFQTGNAIVGKWAVTDYNVPTLPEHYPLERSSIFVPKTSATVVAARVTDCLRLLSITAQYSTGSKVKAKCLTSDSPPVEFRVFLYRGKKKFSHGIIVEVQRRLGYSPKFPMNTAAILEAAEGKVSSCVVPNTFSPSTPSLFQPKEISSQDNDDCLEIPTLTLTKKMLLISSSDHLALESLLSLTDPKKVGLTTASNVVQSILSKNEGNSVVTDILLNLVLDIKNVKRGEQIKRHFAFMIWTNIFYVTSIINNSSILQHHEECLAHQLVPVILQTIDKKSSKHFGVADVAAKCLYFLLKARRDIKDCPSLIDSRALDILNNAYCYGREYHESLAKHSELCMITIKNDKIPALP